LPAATRTLEAAQSDPPAWLLEAATALFDRAVADAEDRDGRPGLIYTVDANARPVIAAPTRQELDQDMAPATSTWTGKPDLYHSYQALLLPSLPLSPTTATALAKISGG